MLKIKKRQNGRKIDLMWDVHIKSKVISYIENKIKIDLISSL